MDELRKGLGVMQDTWFELWVGTWPGAIDWTAAVVDTYLVSALSSLSKALDRQGNVASAAKCRELDSGDIENELNQYFAHNVSRLRPYVSDVAPVDVANVGLGCVLLRRRRVLDSK